MKLCGGKVLDTPGFSSVDLVEFDEIMIRSSFVEFQKYPCPYKDCRHLNEKECEVKKAVRDAKILNSRYENYCKFIGR